ncbi:MAG: PAS domain S-box protein [Oligoflexales bacterium]|nr:PAS domain S-box protein [Oligoflexales bacterium]
MNVINQNKGLPSGKDAPLKLSPEILTRYFLRFLMGSVVAFFGLSAVFYIWVRSDAMSYTCALFALLMCGFIFVLKKTTDVEPVINIAIFSFFVFFIVSAVMTGGTLGTFGSTILAIPIISFFLVGLGAARFWFSVCLLLFFTERALSLFGMGGFPNAINANIENVSKSIVYLVVLCGPFFILDFFTRKKYNLFSSFASFGGLRKSAYGIATKETLKNYEDLLLQLMDSSSDSIQLYDKNLNWIDINPSALRLIGKEKEELIGKNITELVPSLKESGRIDVYYNVMETGKSTCIEDTIPTGHGTIFVKTTVIKFGEGCAIITRDITEERRFKAG